MPTALKCQDLSNWRDLPIQVVKYLVCPDCYTLIPDKFVKFHIQYHEGLNIWDPNYQNYKKDPYEEGGS